MGTSQRKVPTYVRKMAGWWWSRSNDQKPSGGATGTNVDTALHYLDNGKVSIPQDVFTEGAFAKVYKGTYSGELCAVKVFNSGTKKEQIEEEAKVMTDIGRSINGALSKPENIVHLYGLWYNTSKGSRLPCLVMEYFEETLFDLLKAKVRQSFPLSEKLQILHGVCKGMVYLHARHLIHGDLHAANVLISIESSAYIPKICDFGTTKYLEKGKDYAITKGRGKEEFMPPEVLSQSKSFKLNKAIDIFSYGCLVLHVLVCQFPKPNPYGKSDSEYRKRQKWIDMITSKDKEVFNTIIVQCLDKEPSMRGQFPSIQRCLAGHLKHYDTPEVETLDELTIKNEELEGQIRVLYEQMEKAKGLAEELSLANQTKSDLQRIKDSLENKIEELQQTLDKEKEQSGLKSQKIEHLELEVKRVEDLNKKTMEGAAGIDGVVQKYINEKEQALKLASDKEKLESERSSLNQQVNELTAKVVRLETKSSSLAKENRSLKDKLEEANHSKDVLQRDKSSLEREHTTLKEEYQDIWIKLKEKEDQLNTSVMQRQSLTESLNTNSASMTNIRQELNKKGNEIFGLKRDLKNAEAERDLLKSSKQNLEDEKQKTKRLERQQVQDSQKLEKQTNEIAQLQNDLAKARQSNFTLENLKKRLDSSCETKDQQISTLEESMKELKSKKREFTITIRKLEKDLENEKEAVQSLQSDNSQLEEQKKELQKEIAGLVFTVTTQKDVLRERLADIEKLEKKKSEMEEGEDRISSLEKDIEKLTKEKEELSNALHKKVEEFTRTYTANEDLKMKLTELEEKKKEKERSLVKCESEIESLTEDNQALKEKNTKLTIESNACGERNDVLVQRNNKLEEDNKKKQAILKELNLELEQKMKSARESLLRKSDEIQKMKEDLDKAQDELKAKEVVYMEGNESSLKLKEQVSTLQKQVEIAEGKFTQLKKDYNSLEDGNLVMQAQMEQAINELREKSEQLAKLETKLSLLRDQHEVYQEEIARLGAENTIQVTFINTLKDDLEEKTKAMNLLEQQCKKMESLLKHESELREQEFRTSEKRERLLKRAREEIVILKEKIASPAPDLDTSMPVMQPDIKAIVQEVVEASKVLSERDVTQVQDVTSKVTEIKAKKNPKRSPMKRVIASSSPDNHEITVKKLKWELAELKIRMKHLLECFFQSHQYTAMLNDLWNIHASSVKGRLQYKEGSLVLYSLQSLKESEIQFSLIIGQSKTFKALLHNLQLHLKNTISKSSSSIVFLHYGSDVTLYRLHILTVPKLLKAMPNFDQHQEGGAIPEALFCSAKCTLTEDATKELNHFVEPSRNGVFLKDEEQPILDQIAKSAMFDALPGFLKYTVSQMDCCIIKELESQYERFANPPFLVEIPDCQLLQL